MTVFSLRTAALQAGTSKSTILRAIKAGRLSAGRTADGGYEIDPAELSRVYPPTQQLAGQDATGSVAHETAIRMAVMEAELAGLKAMVAELQQSRDGWQRQAETAQRLLTDARPAAAAPPTPARPWWKRLAG
jgi:hypothetical protein